ncbi:hypothetical protein TRV_07943 [Trichophyton verrucosum HKI 0517]|uniref:Myb-like DNA-binding domain-containing protein n=1 Tax=Trichophyton verrucosum (strain HKI 0517) TaxID=663202 RepID=D4DL69_TRIVH|nr:uncharacterized protein TRV_07943 [Trichophyton verrucosum HKI 0517]EFE37410.1 hypothetical protein TRV_07943 [Trichophyton verrucosum HKI 0517]
MATVKRSKTMPADGQTTKFLYTILKQLDLKSLVLGHQIDWNLVASQLEITNGHAARMRFSRFRQHMEGNTTSARSPRAKKSKAETAKSKKAMFDEPVKGKERSPTGSASPTVKKEPEPPVKPEPAFQVGMSEPASVSPPPPPQYFYPPGMEAVPRCFENAAIPNPSPFFDFSTVSPAQLTTPSLVPEPVIGYSAPPFGENWVQVKSERADGEIEMQDLFIKTEPNL